jgi:hypothetical protein
MAVEVRGTARFEVNLPRPLFRTRLDGGNPEIEQYRVAADGQRFLLRLPVGRARRTTLVQNWPALLKQ